VDFAIVVVGVQLQNCKCWPSSSGVHGGFRPELTSGLSVNLLMASLIACRPLLTPRLTWSNCSSKPQQVRSLTCYCGTTEKKGTSFWILPMRSTTPL
jgi:hypothetical protein